MKLRYYALLLLTALVLCGCACDHNWSEADCLTAQICGKCEATQGAPLGHDFQAAGCETAEICSRCGATQGAPLGHEWQPATCAAPETCTRCGATQGETLPHSFGKWEIPGEKMERLCTVCDFVETAEIDREVFAWERIIGHWDPYVISFEEDSYYATILGEESLGYCLQVKQDRTVRLLVDDTVYEGPATFDRLDRSDDTDYYIFKADFGEGLQTEFLYMDTEAGGEEVLISLTTEAVVFSRYEEVRKFVQGTWVSSDNAVLYTLTMNEDGTFLDSDENAGTWHVRPLTMEDDYRGQGILLDFTSEEIRYPGILNLNLSMLVGAGMAPLEDYWSGELPGYGSLFIDGKHRNVDKYTAEELEQVQEGLQEGKETILGTWNSRYLVTDDRKNNRVLSEIALDYSITFREDGTFTLLLDRERTGTWRLDGVGVGQFGTSYGYTLQYDDQPETVVGCSYDEYHGLTLLESGSATDTVRSYYFRRPEDPHIAEGEKKLLGQWSATTSWTSPSQTDPYAIDCQLGDTITFYEDGTCIASMGGEKKGIWIVEESQPEGEGELHWYLIQLEGESLPWTAHCDDGKSLSLGKHTEDNPMQDLVFTRQSDEEIVALRQDFLGTWTSVSVTRPAADNNSISWEPNEAYTATFREDGTCLLSVETEITGTWNLDLTSPEEGYSFIDIWQEDAGITHSGTLEPDGVLFVSVYTDSGYYSIWFEKN